MVTKTKETKARLVNNDEVTTEKHFWLLSVRLILPVSIGSRSTVQHFGLDASSCCVPVLHGRNHTMNLCNFSIMIGYSKDFLSRLGSY